MLRAAALLLSSLAGLGSAVSDPSGHSTMLGYDGAGNLVLLRTPDGAETGWEYDGLGRRVQVRDPAARRGSARVLRDPRPAGVGAVPESCRILGSSTGRRAGKLRRSPWAVEMPDRTPTGRPEVLARAGKHGQGRCSSMRSWGLERLHPSLGLQLPWRGGVDA